MNLSRLVVSAMMNNIGFVVSSANITQFSEQTNLSCKYLPYFTIFVKCSEFRPCLLIVIDLTLKLMGFLSYILCFHYWDSRRNGVILLYISRLPWPIFYRQKNVLSECRASAPFPPSRSYCCVMRSGIADFGIV